MERTKMTPIEPLESTKTNRRLSISSFSSFPSIMTVNSLQLFLLLFVLLMLQKIQLQILYQFLTFPIGIQIRTRHLHLMLHANHTHLDPLFFVLMTPPHTPTLPLLLILLSQQMTKERNSPKTRRKEKIVKMTDECNSLEMRGFRPKKVVYEYNQNKDN